MLCMPVINQGSRTLCLREPRVGYNPIGIGLTDTFLFAHLEYYQGRLVTHIREPYADFTMPVKDPCSKSNLSDDRLHTAPL